MPFLLSEISETYGRRRGAVVYLREAAAARASLDVMSTDSERRKEGARLLFHELPDSSDSDRRKTLRQTNFAHRLFKGTCARSDAAGPRMLKQPDRVEGPAREHGEHISCYMALPGLLLKASHILLPSWKDTVV